MVQSTVNKQFILEQISLHVERLVTHAFLIPNFLVEVFPFPGFTTPAKWKWEGSESILPSHKNSTQLFWGSAYQKNIKVRLAVWHYASDRRKVM